MVSVRLFPVVFFFFFQPDKPCGHPGDTEYGFFELTTGTEFVFGARVEYRCNDG